MEPRAKFYWVATLKNGEEIQQFDENGVDRTFKTVEENQSELRTLELRSDLLNTLGVPKYVYRLNVEDGSFFLNGTTIYAGVDIAMLENFSVVYFRRNSVYIMTEREPEIIGYILGWKSDTVSMKFMITPGKDIILLA